ncbi:MAG: excinuclease ABC subunit UvrC, partial [Rhodospirillales bacterium]|nr:excinuclease ABC subunit UvrC [Rhodospirillales bacterium]
MKQNQTVEEPGRPALPLKGVDVIKSYLKTLPGDPGVYRMINHEGDVLYVGKAKNLKKRVSNYANPSRQSIRIQRMINQTRSMEFVTTHTEAEALLLEANLIKKLTPRYNILLRDDKSFPYILITGDHAYPQILKYRGTRKRKGEYFGPFASAGAVNQSLAILQRAFLLRSCTDSVFASRIRPCLLYQIKRCSAPCVDITTGEAYARLVEQARSFLTGRSKTIQKQLAEEMQALSDSLQFEEAAVLRDRIKAMTNIQSHQDIQASNIDEADIIALHLEAGQACIQVFFLRAGANYGNRAYYPAHTADAPPEQIMEAFLGQFYANKIPPKLILLSTDVVEKRVLTDALSERGGRRVHLSVPSRGDKRNLVRLALENARKALNRRLVESATQRQLLNGLAEKLELDHAPDRIEVYDNSHISGTNAIGAMIVSGPEGFIKNAYRKFNIKAVGEDTEFQAGDDYAMMREVLTRRFSRAQREDPDRSGGQWPDLVLIDGGAGQLSATRDVFGELGITDVGVAAIAKGPDRNAGRERMFLPDREPFTLDSRDPVLYFLQRLRDEAHRFAISTHLARRAKGMKRSPLDEIRGVG